MDEWMETEEGSRERGMEGWKQEGSRERWKEGWTEGMKNGQKKGRMDENEQRKEGTKKDGMKERDDGWMSQFTHHCPLL